MFLLKSAIIWHQFCWFWLVNMATRASERCAAEAFFGRFRPIYLYFALKMAPRTIKTENKVVGPCLFYLLTKFGGCRMTYVVTDNLQVWKIIVLTRLVTYFSFLHMSDDTFGKFLWGQSCSIMKTKPIYQISSQLANVCGHSTLGKKKMPLSREDFVLFSNFLPI